MRINVESKPAVNGHRIFLIDPDMINRSTLYFMVADANETHEFDSVKHIAAVDTHLVPDLVIVNAILVAGHGKALIQGWRSAWPQVKVLVICEACDTECELAAKAAGANDTLLRPFKKESVQRKVDRWLTRPIKNSVEVNIPMERIRSSPHLHH